MENKDNLSEGSELKLILQELKENPYRKFNFAFSLMAIIPFLIFFYLLVSRLFSIDILIGDIGLVLFISIVVSLSGFWVGYSILRSILRKVIIYAAEAKRSDQLKSTFVATVSHELKSPISIIKINLSNIQDGLLGSISHEQKGVIELCRGVIERITRLINDLLDLHKIEAGLIGVSRKLCDLKEVFERQSKELEAAFNKKQIKLVKQISDKDLSVWADEDKVAQVITNLLSNAIKYTPEGGTVTSRIYPVDGFARLECIDTGPGIPTDRLDKVFDKFERLDMTKEGTGLGLSITKDIVQMHKGKIWVESVAGEGSKFIVILPCDLRGGKR